MSNVVNPKIKQNGVEAQTIIAKPKAQRMETKPKTIVDTKYCVTYYTT